MTAVVRRANAGSVIEVPVCGVCSLRHQTDPAFRGVRNLLDPWRPSLAFREKQLRAKNLSRPRGER
jgi:hypothetical protein